MTEPTKQWMEKKRQEFGLLCRAGASMEDLTQFFAAIHAEVYAKAIEELRDKAFENRLMDTIKHAVWFREEMKREKAKARRETLEEVRSKDMALSSYRFDEWLAEQLKEAEDEA